MINSGPPSEETNGISASAVEAHKEFLPTRTVGWFVAPKGYFFACGPAGSGRLTEGELPPLPPMTT